MKESAYSIQFKILAIVMAFFVLIVAAFFVYSVATTANFKQLRIAEVSKTIAFESERVGKAIAEMERNAVDLAPAGAGYYRSGRYQRDLGAAISMENFDSFRASVGGGIWFEPFVLDSTVRRTCFYAFYDTSIDKMVYDPEFESPDYDYHNQDWYKEIAAALKKKYQSVWTSPYVDDAGTNALMTTVGAGIYDRGGRFIGMSTVDWEIQNMVDSLSAIKPSENSFVLLASPQDDYVVMNTHQNKTQEPGASLKELSWYSSLHYDNDGGVSVGNFKDGGAKYYSFSRIFDNGWLFSIQIPSNEIFREIENRNISFTIIIAISSLVLFFLTSYLISRLITHPLHSLVTGVTELGNGNLTVRTRLNTHDEIGSMAKSLDATIVHLHTSMDEIAAISGETTTSATQLTSITNTVSRNAYEMDKGAKTQQDILKTTSDSLNQLIEDISIACKMSTESAEVTAKALDGTSNCRNKMNESVKAMKEILDSSEQIGKIITVISQIARRTNLLSFNAAIEAASAGKHGKGFAVVADEIRKLAEGSASAAKDVTALITVSNEKAKIGSQIVSELDSLLIGIEANVRKSADIATQSSATLEEQVQVGQQAVGSMQSTFEVAQRNLESIQNLTESISHTNKMINDLAGHADAMNNLTRRFKL